MTAPSGSVTFLFSDIEGSTKRWARDRDAMQEAVRVHDRLMREAVTATGGYVFKTMGDAFFIAYATPESAAAAALGAQRSFATTDFSAVGGLHVRMALNTGIADERDGDYFGPALNFVARLLVLGHGGQVLLSANTAALLRDALPPQASLTDLGEHGLKDIDGHERIFQLVTPDLQQHFPELRSQHALQPWLVPETRRTRYFTGRDDVLDQVCRRLAEQHRAALCGLGGVGKTQTAIEYAVRHRSAYPNGVFWVDAETVGGLTNGFVEIAKALQVPAAASSEQKDAVAAVLARLNRMDGWLLILDNVEDRGTIREFVPERDKGDVLITSRESVFVELGISQAIAVGDLGADESVHFLLMRSGREIGDSNDRALAAELAAELGHLPLALEQAAAYIAETGVTFGTYLGVFRKRRLSLLEKAAGLVAHDTVAATWKANFDAVERASRAAADVLRLSAFLAPDAIPFELFLNGASMLGQSIAEALADPDDLTMVEVLRPLARYSLIRSDAAARVFGVHRLVQEMTSAALPDAERRIYVERAVCALDASFPEVTRENRTQCERLVLHATSIERWIDGAVDSPETWGRVLDSAGRYLREQSRYVEAQPLLTRALAVREAALGPDHLDVASSLNDVASLFFDQGRYAEAQSHYERALAIREKVLGPNDLEVARTLNNLAVITHEQGRSAEAQPLYERALAIREATLGPNHPVVARSLNSLATVHHDRGRLAEASTFYERALAILERALGPDAPDLSYSLINLAEVRLSQGRPSEAQLLAERALAIWEKALGPDHTYVASSLNMLAEIYYAQGRLAEAQSLLARALALCEKSVGPNHPLVAVSLRNLANVYVTQHRLADAESLYERAIGIWERALGNDHPTLSEPLIRFASLRERQGRVVEARRLYERALVIKERVSGVDGPGLAELRTTIGALPAER